WLAGRDRQSEPSRQALPPIDGLAPRDRQEPRPELRLPAKAAQFPVGRHEGLLSHVVGFSRGSDGGQGGAEDRPAVALDELTERLGVTGLRQSDEVEIGGHRGLRLRRSSGGLAEALAEAVGAGHTISRLSRAGAGWVTFSCRTWLKTRHRHGILYRLQVTRYGRLGEWKQNHLYVEP